MTFLIVILFIVGYLVIALEHRFNINKAGTALLTGVLCWTLYALNSSDSHYVSALSHHLAEISEIIFFLLGAMTIVELIDAHGGFDVITKRITSTDKRKLLWIAGFLSKTQKPCNNFIPIMCLNLIGAKAIYFLRDD